eukprot:gene5182-5704_t
MDQFGRAFYSYPLTIILTILFTAFWTIVLSQHNTPLATLTCVITFLFTTPILWALTFLKCSRNVPLRDNFNLFFYLENGFLISITANLGLILLMQVLNSPCKAFTFIRVISCSPFAKCDGLAESVPLLLFLSPLFCAMTLPTVSSKILIPANLWAHSVILTAMNIIEGYLSLPFVIMATFIFASLQLIHSFTQLKLYINFVSIRESEERRYQETLQKADDIRQLIGKIAHDIRTPVVAIDYGLQSLTPSMDKLANAISLLHHNTELSASADAPWQNLQCEFNSCTTALEGLQQSHLHLMMIIDRCMDYHKLSHGLPLIPKYAPTSLSLVIETVLNHARKTLDNMLVKVERADVLGYIVTDPGWLQDNLLCLISNAIRFSSPRSPVLIRIIRGSPEPEQPMDTSTCSDKDEQDRPNRAMMEICPGDPNVPSLSSTFTSVSTSDISSSLLPIPQQQQNQTQSQDHTKEEVQLNLPLINQPYIAEKQKHDQEEETNARKDVADQIEQQTKTITSPIKIESNSNSQPALRTIRFEVEDFGLGISDLLLPTLFLPPEGPAPSQHNAHDRDALHQQESNKSNNYNDYPPNSQHQEILPHEDQRGNVGGAGLGLYCLAERVKALQGDFGVIRKDKPSQFPHVIQLQDLHKQPLREEREQGEGGEIKEEDQQQEETKTLEQTSAGVHHHPASSHPSSNDAKGCIFWFSLPLNRKSIADLESDSSLIRRSMDSVHLSSPGSFDLGDGITAHEVNVEEESEQGSSIDKQDETARDSFMAASPTQRHQQREDTDTFQTRLFRPDSEVSFSSDRRSASPPSLSHGKPSSSWRSNSFENTILSPKANQEDDQQPPAKIPTASAHLPTRAPSALATTPRIPSLRAPAVGSNASSNSFINTRMDQAVIHLLNDLHLRVMILDDSPLILKMLKMMFLSKGHEVVTTTNGIEALAILKQSFEMQVQSERRVTANTDHITMQDSYASGADHFLQKPFNLDTFYAVLLKHRKFTIN